MPKKKKISGNVTILIPTYNRHRQLKRLLDYYSNCAFPILVADSTTASFPFVKNYRNVKYFHYPNYPYAKKLPLIYKHVKTEYVLFCADDDFVIPDAIQKCLNFLEDNPDYSSAHGHYVFFENRNKENISVYPFYLARVDLDINSNRPSERVTQLLSSYMQLLYAVTKTSDIKQVFNYLAEYPEIKNDNLVEIFQAIILCINGKSKTLPIFYCAREKTPNSASTYTDDLDVICCKAKYTKQYRVWLDVIAKHLAKKERIPQTEAKEKILLAVNLYLANSFMYIPFLRISFLSIQRAVNKYSLGFAKKVYNLILPPSGKNNLKKHAFSRKDSIREFDKIQSYIYQSY